MGSAWGAAWEAVVGVGVGTGVFVSGEQTRGRSQGGEGHVVTAGVPLAVGVHRDDAAGVGWSRLALSVAEAPEAGR